VRDSVLQLERRAYAEEMREGVKQETFNLTEYDVKSSSSEGISLAAITASLSSTMHISSYSVCSFLVIVIGYTATSLFLKSICAKRSSAFRTKGNGKHPLHNLFTSINLLMAAGFATAVTEMAINDRTGLTTGDISTYSCSQLIVVFVKMLLCESVLEYYWHRAMHMDWLYSRVHKFHHFYKEPEPFDDMFIYPPEAFGYYCILYSPAFFFRTHYTVFVLYMILMGMCGILDHCGLKLSVLMYSTVDHDIHHSKFKFNYGFPFIFMDILHGTYLTRRRASPDS